MENYLKETSGVRGFWLDGPNRILAEGRAGGPDISWEQLVEDGLWSLRPWVTEGKGFLLRWFSRVLAKAGFYKQVCIHEPRRRFRSPTEVWPTTASLSPGQAHLTYLIQFCKTDSFAPMFQENEPRLQEENQFAQVYKHVNKRQPQFGSQAPAVSICRSDICRWWREVTKSKRGQHQFYHWTVARQQKTKNFVWRLLSALTLLSSVYI